MKNPSLPGMTVGERRGLIVLLIVILIAIYAVAIYDRRPVESRTEPSATADSLLEVIRQHRLPYDSIGPRAAQQNNEKRQNRTGKNDSVKVKPSKAKKVFRPRSPRDERVD